MEQEKQSSDAAAVLQDELMIQASKQASIFIRPINKHTYSIDDTNAQGQAARKALAKKL